VKLRKQCLEDKYCPLFSSIALIYRKPARNYPQKGKERPQVNTDRYTTTYFLSMKPERGGGDCVTAQS
jgi:hypothetical protein